MSVGVEIRVSGFSGLPEKVSRGTVRGVERAAQVTANQVDRQKRRTYSRRTRDGRPRTGNYLRGTAVKETGEFERKVVTEGPAATPITNYPNGYAEKLVTLPVSSDGIARANPAFDDAQAIVEPQVAAIVDQAILEELS